MGVENGRLVIEIPDLEKMESAGILIIRKVNLRENTGWGQSGNALSPLHTHPVFLCRE
ncbi:MAG: hypothetical protein R6V06_08965 [Kiritimatiellia bacterium]